MELRERGDEEKREDLKSSDFSSVSLFYSYSFAVIGRLRCVTMDTSIFGALWKPAMLHGQKNILKLMEKKTI